jgi:hypothetical protein
MKGLEPSRALEAFLTRADSRSRIAQVDEDDEA